MLGNIIAVGQSIDAMQRRERILTKLTLSTLTKHYAVLIALKQFIFGVVVKERLWLSKLGEQGRD